MIKRLSSILRGAPSADNYRSRHGNAPCGRQRKRLAGRLTSWRLHVEAANLSPKTITTYLDAVSQLRGHLGLLGMPTAVDALSREHLESFLVALRERTSASTAATRYRGLQQFFKWLLEEGEITRNPMERMRPPKLQERPVPVIPDDDLKALFKVCAGKDFEDRRDRALLRLFLNTGARLSEMSNLRVADCDLSDRSLYVTGKGRKGRSLPQARRPSRILTGISELELAIKTPLCHGFGLARRAT